MDWRGSNSTEEHFKITPVQTNLDASERDSKGLALLLFSFISWSLVSLVPWNKLLRPATLPFWMARKDCRRYSSRALRALWLLSSSAALERRTGWNEWEEWEEDTLEIQTAIYPFSYKTTYYLYSLYDLILRTVKLQCITTEMADWVTTLVLHRQAHQHARPELWMTWSLLAITEPLHLTLALARRRKILFQDIFSTGSKPSFIFQERMLSTA